MFKNITLATIKEFYLVLEIYSLTCACKHLNLYFPFKELSLANMVLLARKINLELWGETIVYLLDSPLKDLASILKAHPDE